MKVEQAKQIASNAIEQLRQALEAGHSEKLTQHLAAMARFHRYSLHNVMLIALQKPNATHVAGFQAWHKLGRFVKKGEKGILILAPIIRKNADNNAETEPDEFSVAVGFRAAYVFDISQTDGQPLPEIGGVNGDPYEYRERLAKFVDDQSIALEYSDAIAPARGTSSGRRIMLLSGQSPAEEFATLAHEVAHEMMHRDERRSNTTTRIRETEAEAVAFVVCSAIGLETGSAAQDYIGLYGGDAKLLSTAFTVSRRIQRTGFLTCSEVFRQQIASDAKTALRAHAVDSSVLGSRRYRSRPVLRLRLNFARGKDRKASLHRHRPRPSLLRDRTGVTSVASGLSRPADSGPLTTN